MATMVRPAPLSSLASGVREFTMDALDEAGYTWAHHGSHNKGHKNVPPEMKGNIVVDTFVASEARINAAGVWTNKGVNVKFVECKMAQQAWFHPIFMGGFIFGAAGVSFQKIHDLKQQLCAYRT